MNPFLLLGLLGTGLQVAGTVAAASDAKKQALYNQQVAEINAEIGRENAADTRARGRVEEAKRGKLTAQTMATARVAMAANGMEIDTRTANSAREVLMDLAEAGAVDVLTIRDNFAKEEYRARVQGASYSQQATLYGMEAGSISPALAGLTAGVKGLAGLKDFF